MPANSAARLAVRIIEALADEQASRSGRYPGEPDVSRERFADTIAQLRMYAAVVPEVQHSPDELRNEIDALDGHVGGKLLDLIAALSDSLK